MKSIPNLTTTTYPSLTSINPNLDYNPKLILEMFEDSKLVRISVLHCGDLNTWVSDGFYPKFVHRGSSFDQGGSSHPNGDVLPCPITSHASTNPSEKLKPNSATPHVNPNGSAYKL